MSVRDLVLGGEDGCVVLDVRFGAVRVVTVVLFVAAQVKL